MKFDCFKIWHASQKQCCCKWVMSPGFIAGTTILAPCHVDSAILRNCPEDSAPGYTICWCPIFKISCRDLISIQDTRIIVPVNAAGRYRISVQNPSKPLISWNRVCSQRISQLPNRFAILHRARLWYYHTLRKISKRLGNWNDCFWPMRFRGIWILRWISDGYFEYYIPPWIYLASYTCHLLSMLYFLYFVASIPSFINRSNVFIIWYRPLL